MPTVSPALENSPTAAPTAESMPTVTPTASAASTDASAKEKRWQDEFTVGGAKCTIDARIDYSPLEFEADEAKLYYAQPSVFDEEVVQRLVSYFSLELPDLYSAGSFFEEEVAAADDSKMHVIINSKGRYGSYTFDFYNYAYLLLEKSSRIEDAGEPSDFFDKVTITREEALDMAEQFLVDMGLKAYHIGIADDEHRRGRWVKIGDHSTEVAQGWWIYLGLELGLDYPSGYGGYYPLQFAEIGDDRTGVATGTMFVSDDGVQTFQFGYATKIVSEETVGLLPLSNIQEKVTEYMAEGMNGITHDLTASDNLRVYELKLIYTEASTEEDTVDRIVPTWAVGFMGTDLTRRTLYINAIDGEILFLQL